MIRNTHKNKIPPEGQGYNNEIQFETEFDKQGGNITGEKVDTQHNGEDDMWEVWIVGHDEMRESRVEHAMMVVIDSAATVGVIGKHEKERVRNRRKAPRVRVRTAIGIVEGGEGQ